MATDSIITLERLRCGWSDFKFLFAGRNLAGEDRIYAVDKNGQLLSYGDAGTPGNVSSPMVVGFGGWWNFKFVFAGKNAAGEDRIYAVRTEFGSSDGYVIEGNLQVRPVRVDLCQAEVNAVQAAQSVVDAIDAEIRDLQAELQNASPTEKPFIISEIKRLRKKICPSRWRHSKRPAVLCRPAAPEHYQILVRAGN